MSARGFIFASRQSTSGLKRYVLKVPIPELPIRSRILSDLFFTEEE